jgi:hypothetical protein
MLSACWISLHAKGQTGYKSCLVTIDTGVSMMLAIEDIVKLPMKCRVHTASGETLPIMQEPLLWGGAN